MPAGTHRAARRIVGDGGPHRDGGRSLVKTEPFKDDRGITETRFTLRLTRHRMNPDPRFSLSFLRAFHKGNNHFTAAGRTFHLLP